jgi:hypothetical protein
MACREVDSSLHQGNLALSVILNLSFGRLKVSNCAQKSLHRDLTGSDMGASEKACTILSQSHHMFNIIYFIYYGNRDAPSSITDVDLHDITIKLLHLTFNFLVVFIHWCKIQAYLHRMFQLNN